MSRKARIFISFLFFAALIVVIGAVEVRAATITVDDSGGKEYTTIQAAVDAASTNDTITVYEGTYAEAITLSKRVSLVGVGRNNVIIDPGYDTNTITVTADYANISGLTIKAGSSFPYYSPVRLNGAGYVTIKNCNLTDRGSGVAWLLYAYNSFSNIINGNTFYRSTTANAYPDYGAGLMFESSSTGSGSTITNNGFSGTYPTGNVAALTWSTAYPDMVIMNNSFNIAGGVAIYGNGGSNIMIKGNVMTITTSNYGMLIQGITDSVIASNTITISSANYYGIYGFNFNNVTIGNNTVTGAGNAGIYIYYAENVKIIGNTVSNSQKHGIQMEERLGGWTYPNIIMNNTVQNNNQESSGSNSGIYLSSTVPVNITGNNIQGNNGNTGQGYGLWTYQVASGSEGERSAQNNYWNDAGGPDYGDRVGSGDGNLDYSNYAASAFAANTVPTATMTTPANGATYKYGIDTISLSGYGTDTENGSLTGYLVLWYSNISGYLGSGNITLGSTSLTAGTHMITMEAHDWHWATAKKTTEITVAVPPTVYLSVSPMECDKGDSVSLNAYAIDQNGNVLTNGTWVSSLNGTLGTGNLTRTNLSAGTHTLWYNATDGSNLVGSGNTSLTIHNNLTVGSGAGNYTTIQNAINASLNGDKVFVYNGTYYEHVVVNKSIRLVGKSMGGVVINGSEMGVGVGVVSNSVIFQNFTIKNVIYGLNITSNHSKIENITIAWLSGANGTDGTGGSPPSAGQNAGSLYGICLMDSSYNQLSFIKIENVVGANGGAGGSGATYYMGANGGQGGEIYGLYFSSSNNNTLTSITLTNFTGANGGRGGKGGDDPSYGTGKKGGDGRNGGYIYAHYFSSSNNNTLTSITLTNFTGANGGMGGDGGSSTGNPSWGGDGGNGGSGGSVVYANITSAYNTSFYLCNFSSSSSAKKGAGGSGGSGYFYPALPGADGYDGYRKMIDATTPYPTSTYIINSSFTHTIDIGTTSYLSVSHYIDVYTKYNSNNTPISSPVSIKDDMGTDTHTLITSSFGWSNQTTITQYKISSGVNTSYTPHNFTATLGEYFGYTVATIDSYKQINITLNDTVAPVSWTNIARVDYPYNLNENYTGGSWLSPGGSIWWNFSATDGGDGVDWENSKYRVWKAGGSQWTSWLVFTPLYDPHNSPPYNFIYDSLYAPGDSGKPMADGINHLEFYAKDIAGHKEVTKNITVEIDSYLPTGWYMLNGSTGENGWSTSDVQATMNATDNISGVYSRQYADNNGSWSEYTTPLTLTATTYLNYKVTDNAGNAATGGVWVKIDKDVPTTSYSVIGTLGANGWYKSNIDFTINANDATSDVMGKRYVYNNGTSWNYTNTTFTLYESTYVTFNAYDYAGWNSTNTSVWVRIDKVPPLTNSVVASGVLGTNGWYTTNVSINLTATDAISGVNYTQYRVYTTSWITWASYTQNVTLSFEGTQYVEFRSIDMAGNMESTNNISIKIDKTNPTTLYSIISTNGTNGWVITQPTITLSSSDATSGINYTRYRDNSGSWNAYNNISFVLGEGSHIIDYETYDMAGRVIQDAFLVKYDSSKPYTTINLTGALASNDWYSTNVTAILSAIDNYSGVYDTSIRIDNNSWQNYFSPIVATGIGEHTIRWKSYDNASNIEDERSTTIHIDTSLPGLSHTLTGSCYNNWYTSDVNVTLNASAPSGVWWLNYTIDNGSWNSAVNTTILQFVIKTNGTHRIDYYAVSNTLANNSNYVEFSIDQTYPVVTEIQAIGTQGNNSWFIDAPAINITASDSPSGISHIKYKLNATGNYNEYTGSLAILYDGIYTIYAYAIDTAGHASNETSLQFKVDLTRPSTSDSKSGTIGNGTWYVGNVSTTLSATDYASGMAYIEYKLDSEEWCNYSAPINLSNGTHTLDYRSRDLAGNLEAAKNTTINIDIIIPTANATVSGAPGSNGYFVSNVFVNISAADDLSGIANIRYMINNGSWSNFSEALVLNASGNYSIEYKAIDNAGWISNIGYTDVHLDIEKPTVTIQINATSGWNGYLVSPAMITITASDVTTSAVEINYSVDGAAFTVYAGAFNITIDGEHVISARAKDYAGNVGDITNQTIKIDIVAPQISHSLNGTIGLSDFFTSNVNASIVASDAFAGVNKTEYNLDNIGWTSYTPFIIDTGAIHTLQMRSYDNASNMNITVATIKIDKNAPTTTAIASGNIGNSLWYIASASVNLTATDDLSGVKNITYRINNGSYTNYTNNISLTEDNCYIITYFTYDMAGNAELPRYLYINISQTPPNTTYALNGSTGGNNWYVSSVEVTLYSSSGSLSGINHTNYSINNATYEMCSQPIWLNSSGIYFIQFYSVTNASIQEPTRNFTVFIDKNAPATAAAINTAIGNNSWYRQMVNITISASDNGSGLSQTEYKLDESGWAAGTALNVSTEGNHTLALRSKDLAGNLEGEHSITFKIDSSAPETLLHVNGTQSGTSWHTSNVTIETSILDAYSGPNKTYIRIDNGIWQAYTNMITITTNGTHIIEAYSFDNAGNQGTINTTTFKMDRGVPETVAEIVGEPATWYTSDVTIYLNISSMPTSGINTTKYRVDNGTLKDYTGQITVSSNGAHRLEYYSIGNNTLVESGKHLDFKIDKEKPVVTRTLAGTSKGVWYANAVTIVLSASDMYSGVAAVKYSIDDWDEFAYTAPIVLNESGNHTISFYAIDNAGNIGTADTKTFKIDMTGPTTTIYIRGTEGENNFYTANMLVELSVYDAHSGSKAIFYKINNGAPAEYTQAVDISTDGFFNLTYWSIDNCDNVGAVKTKYIKRDKMPPVTNFMVNGTRGLSNWHTSEAVVTIISSDDTSGVYKTFYKIGSGAYLPYNGTVRLTEGVYTIYAYSIDNAGNNEAVSTYEVKIDSTAPVVYVSVKDPNSNGWYAESVSLSVDVSDTGSKHWYTEYRIGNSSWKMTEDTINVNTDGVNNITIRAWDNAGNNATTTKEIKIDTLKPYTKIEIAGEKYGDKYVNASLSFNATDNFSGVDVTKYRVGSVQIWSVYEAQINLTDGVYNIEWFSTDRNGWREDVRNAVIVVDSTANKPQVRNITVTFDNGININLDAEDPMNGNISVSVYASGPSGEVVVANNASSGNITFDTENVLNGEYTITIYVKNANNQTVKITNTTIVNNNAIRNTTLAGSGKQIVYKGASIPITIAVRNYENRTVTYRLELYDNYAFAGFGGKEINLKPLEASNVTIYYAPGHASTHVFTVKVVDTATSKVVSEKSFIADVLIETETPSANNDNIIFVCVLASFILITGVTAFKLKKTKNTHKVKLERDVKDGGKKEIEIGKEREMWKKEPDQSKCNICLGFIKPSLQVVVCRCGNTYHESCAERVDMCPQCGEKIGYALK